MNYVLKKNGICLALAALLPLLITSCLFIQGVPFHEETMAIESTTWKVQIEKIFPSASANTISTDNDFIIHFTNSLSPEAMGKVTIGNPAITYEDNTNCTITFASLHYPNDTIIIDPYSELQASYSYIGLSIEGFLDYKGNLIDPIIDNSYYFTTAAGTPPEIIAINPAANSLGFPGSSNLTIVFNESLNTAYPGCLTLTSNARMIDLSADVTCNIYYATTNAANDTVVIDPYFDIPGNLYYDISVNGFRDIKGSSMLAYNDNAYMTEFAGLVADWRFNGTTADSGGNWYHPLNVYGTNPAPDRFGAGSSALVFDGSTDYIDYPAIDLTRSFTVSLWIYPMSGDVMPILTKNSIPLGEHDWRAELGIMHASGNKIRFFIGSGESGLYTDIISAAKTSPNRWYHIVAICEQSGADHTLRLYVNGVEDLSRTESYSRKSAPSSEPVQVGRYYLNGAQFFFGRIDDIKIYNYALSPAQISELYTP